MKILLIDNNTDDIASLLHFCKHHNLAYDIVEPAQLDKVSTRMYDFALLSGGLWYDDPTEHHRRYANELTFIEETHLPIIGICLGMQLIASAFGGNLIALRRGHIGKRTIQITEAGIQTLNWSEQVTVHEQHTIGVVSCPPQFDILGQSEDCLEIIKHKSRPIIGVQFHPEKLNKQESAHMVWRSLFNAVEVEYPGTLLASDRVFVS